MTCWGNAHETLCADTDCRSSWERQEKDITSGGQTRMAGTAGVASTEQSRHECQKHLHKLDTASHLVAFIRPRRGIQDKEQPSVGQTRMAFAREGKRKTHQARRTDMIGTRAEGCKVVRGECKACRKTQAGLTLSRHAWCKHVANGKGKKRLEQGRSLRGSQSVKQTRMLQGTARAGRSYAPLSIRPRRWAMSYIEERAQCECVRECCIRRTWKRGEEKNS